MVGQLKEYGFYLKFHGKSLKDFSEGTFIYVFKELFSFLYQGNDERHS